MKQNKARKAKQIKKEPVYLTGDEKNMIGEAFELLREKLKSLLTQTSHHRSLMHDLGIQDAYSVESVKIRDAIEKYVAEQDEKAWKLRNKITGHSHEVLITPKY